MSKQELFARLRAQQAILQELMHSASVVMMEIDDILKEIDNEKQ